MINNEVNEKSKESLTDIINGDLYKFDIVILTTNYFNNKTEILLKIIKNITVNGFKPNKSNIEKLISKIRSDNSIIGNKYQKYNNLQTVKQHYVKNSIQKKWNPNDLLIFKIEDQEDSLENTSLIDYNNICSDEREYFESTFTYVKDFTFDVYGEDYFLYLEDGIVTILEKLFENVIEADMLTPMIAIDDSKIIQTINYFFTPELNNRIDRYKDFSINMFDNYTNQTVISSFFNNFFIDNEILQLFVVNKLDDFFNLTSDWIEYLYYTELYDECGFSWTEALIMPYSTKNALLFLDEISLSYFNKYPFDKEDFLLNTLLSIVNKRMTTSDKGIIGNSYYQSNTLIRLADVNNKKYITDIFETVRISNLLKLGDLKKISHILTKAWHLKNTKNINENLDKTNEIMRKQSENAMKYFTSKGLSADDVLKKLDDVQRNMGSKNR